MNSIQSVFLSGIEANNVVEDGFKNACVAMVVLMRDPCDDEQLVKLDNGIRFIAKWYEAMFWEGEKLEYRLTGEDQDHPTGIEIRTSNLGWYRVHRFPLV